MYANSLSNLYGTDYIYNHSVVNSEIIGNDLNVIDTVTCAVLVINNVSNFSTSGIVFSKELSMGSNKITNITTPTAINDAANKKYVDDSITGLSSSYIQFSNLSSLGYSIIPPASLTYNLGSSSFLYSNIYTDVVSGNNFKLGKISSTQLYLAHPNYFTTQYFALCQTSTGDVFINSPAANSIRFTYDAGNTIMKLNYSASVNQITITGNILPSANASFDIGSSGTGIFNNGYFNILTGQYYKMGTLSGTQLYLAQLSRYNTTDYALTQTSVGYTKLNCASNQAIDLCCNNSNLFRVSPTGLQTSLNWYNNLVPGTTNAYSLGTASLLWSVVYAVNGTIQTSDQDKKQNISTIDDSVAINFIRQLNPVKFQWKPTTSIDVNGNVITTADDKYYPGFLAQQIYNMQTVDTDYIEQNVVSREVNENGDINWGVKYTSIIAPLVKYCQILPDNLIPSQDDRFDIGNASFRYQDIFISGQVFNTSDERHKENIKDADQDKSIALINLLKSKEYNFLGKTRKNIGFIAQNIEKIVYDLDIGHNIVNKSIDRDGKDIYSLDYLSIIPHLVSYSQHLFDKNKRLEARLERLESFISNTNEMLSDIKKTRERTSTLKSPRRITNP